MPTPATLDMPSSPATAAPAPAVSRSAVAPLPVAEPVAEPAAEVPFDLFVVHAAADTAFVEAFLLPALGLPAARVKLAGGAPPEAALLGELQRAVEHSRVFLVIVTPAFLIDPWARHAEDWVVRTAIPAERTVIPLILQRCELPLHLRVAVQLDCSDPQEWEPEAARLRQLFDLPPPLEPQLPCPYPGMRPFRTGEAAQFHGRDREITEVMARLAAGERELYVIGPSGSGKSSLIYAGVLPLVALDDDAAAPALPALPPSPSAPPPALEDRGSFTPPPPLPPPSLLVRTFRPGDAPVTRLLHALRSPSTAAPDLSRLVADLLAEAPAGASLLIFVDQLEELFALCSPAQQHLFAAAVEQLRKHPRCVLLFTLRADFLSELMQSRLWREDSAAHVNVAPLRGPALREAIERPAQLAGVHLEPALVERLLADAAFSPSILPLLQETLVQLWERRRRRLIPLSEYRAMGRGAESGLAIAIANRADRCFAELSPRAQLLAQRVLLRLVRFGEGRANTRRQQRRSDLAGGERPEELTAVLDLLTAARLIVLDAAHLHTTDDDLIDLAHEALLTAWPPLATWIRLRRHDEEQRRIIESRAAQWIARGRTSLGLLDVGELSMAQAWRGSAAGAELGETPDMLALIAASEAELQRRKDRRARMMSAVIAVLLLLTVISTILAVTSHRSEQAAVEMEQLIEQYKEDGSLEPVLEKITELQNEIVLQDSEHQTQLKSLQSQMSRTKPLRAELYRRRGRDSLADGKPIAATAYLAEADRLDPIDNVHDELLHRSSQSQLVAVIPLAHQRKLTSGETSALLLSLDGLGSSRDTTVRIWSLPSGAPVGSLPHPKPVLSMKLTEKDTQVVTVATDDIRRTWNARTGELLSERHEKPLSPAEELHIDFERGTLRVVNRRTGWRSPALHHECELEFAELSDDQRYVATACFPSSGRLSELATGLDVTGALSLTTRQIIDLELTHDNQHMILSTTEEVQIWRINPQPAFADAASTAEIKRQAGLARAPTPSISCNSYSPLGIYWRTQKESRVVAMNRGATLSNTCSLSRLLSATIESPRVVSVWYPAIPRITRALHHSADLIGLFFLERGWLTMLLTVTTEGAQLWDPSTGVQLWSVTSPNLNLRFAAFNSDGVLHTLSRDGTVRRWGPFPPSSTTPELPPLMKDRGPFRYDSEGNLYPP